MVIIAASYRIRKFSKYSGNTGYLRPDRVGVIVSQSSIVTTDQAEIWHGFQLDRLNI